MTTTEIRPANAWIARHDPLRVAGLGDPDSGLVGHDVHSTYVETYWLPVLGPSAVWAARRLSDWTQGAARPVEVPLDALALALGLRSGVANHTPVVRTLARLVDFGIARIEGDVYAVRRRLPALAARHIDRLPAFLRECHRLELEGAR